MPNKLIHCFDLQFLTWLEPHAWKSPMVNKEWNSLCGGVYMVVILELTKWEKLIPIILSLRNEDVYVLLQFLIDAFCLTIGLRMIRS
jgi:hypothetical protein